MKTYLSFGIFSTILFSYIFLVETAIDNDRSQFDWSVFRALAKNDKNIIYSPISLKIILSMLSEGAAGLTKIELFNVLGITNETENRLYYEDVIKHLKGYDPDYDINVDTNIFINSHIHAMQPFAGKAKSFYYTGINSTNFSDPQGAANYINDWVRAATRGKIRQLVNSGDIENAVMLIVNALYFKAPWDEQFRANETAFGGFYRTPDNVINVEYMKNTAKYYYTESKELDAAVLRIPYKDQKYSFVALLPKTKAGLSTVISKLNVLTLNNIEKMMDHIPVQVHLPKFKFSFKSGFAEVLRNYGLSTMFQHTASFAGISRGGSNLYVSDIIQKAGIEVNEEGSVVFAASGVQLGNKFGDVQYIFNASHPFAFYIKDHATNTILFVGKVENPLSTDEVNLPNRFQADNNSNNLQQAQLQPVAIPQLNLTPAAFDVDAQQLSSPNSGFFQQPSDTQSILLVRFNNFDIELLKEVGRTRSNVFLSPASIKTTLSMILEGAYGKSAEDITRVIGIPKGAASNQLTPLVHILSVGTNSTIITTSSGIFVSVKREVPQQYIQRIQDTYRGFVQRLDFSNPRYATQEINNWAKKQTHGLIENLVTPDNFQNEAAVVVANAVYFKGIWQKAFDPQRTSSKRFRTIADGSTMADMMQNIETYNYKYFADIDTDVIELPYSDNIYAMYIFLPRKNDVDILVRDLGSTLSARISELKETEVLLEMPKFSIEFEADLSTSLQYLGINDIFRPSANLSGIVKGGETYVSSIIHKAKIEVDESGTVAAGATGAIVIPLMGTSRPRVVADHPFAFFILNKNYGTTLFEGILYNPGSGPLKQRSQNEPYQYVSQQIYRDPHFA